MNTNTETEMIHLKFACGATLACPEDSAHNFPVGAKHVVEFTRASDMCRPQLDGKDAPCLLNCPAKVKDSKYECFSAWGEDDTSEHPGRVVKCRIISHE